MKKHQILKYGIAAETAFLIVLLITWGIRTKPVPVVSSFFSSAAEKEKDYITWVDFTVSREALDCAYEYDVGSYGTKEHVDWISLLAYVAAKHGGDFSDFQKADVDEAAEEILEQGLEPLLKEKNFAYYYEAYSAALGGMVGEYEVCGDSAGSWQKVYGLKAFSPIARGFSYQGYDDFGAERSFGFKRPHLGHDMLGEVGTPIIAIESGYVTALGWNQYGGWRVGITSFDGKRYYYYAHMRQNRPYAKGLQEGEVVTAGDVIGYMGRTGYSKTENVNNIEKYHLHVGLQLIFDESQREGDNEIWIDMYPLTNFLSRHRSEVVRDAATKEWSRKYQLRDPAAQKALNGQEEQKGQKALSGMGTSNQQEE